MTAIKSNIDSNSEEYLKNYSHNLNLVNDLRERFKEIIHRPDDLSVKRHKERGKLLVRERIEILIDKSTPFLELSILAATCQYEDNFP